MAKGFLSFHRLSRRSQGRLSRSANSKNSQFIVDYRVNEAIGSRRGLAVCTRCVICSSSPRRPSQPSHSQRPSMFTTAIEAGQTSVRQCNPVEGSRICSESVFFDRSSVSERPSTPRTLAVERVDHSRKRRRLPQGHDGPVSRRLEIPHSLRPYGCSFGSDISNLRRSPPPLSPDGSCLSDR